VPEFLPNNVNAVIIQLDSYDILDEYMSKMNIIDIENEKENITISIYEYINKKLLNVATIDTLIILSPNIILRRDNVLYAIEIGNLSEGVFKYYANKYNLSSIIITNIDNYHAIQIKEDVFTTNLTSTFVGTKHDVDFRNDYLWCLGQYIDKNIVSSIYVDIKYYTDVTLNSFFRCLPYDSLCDLYFSVDNHESSRHLLAFLKFHLGQFYNGRPLSLQKTENEKGLFYNICLDEDLIRF